MKTIEFKLSFQSKGRYPYSRYLISNEDFLLLKPFIKKPFNENLFKLNRDNMVEFDDYSGLLGEDSGHILIDKINGKMYITNDYIKLLFSQNRALENPIKESFGTEISRLILNFIKRLPFLVVDNFSDIK